MIKCCSKKAEKRWSEQKKCNWINHTGEWTEWGRGGGRLIMESERQRGVWRTGTEGDDSPGGERATCDLPACSFIASPSLPSPPPLCWQTLFELICLQRVKVQWRLLSLKDYRWGWRYEERASLHTREPRRTSVIITMSSTNCSDLSWNRGSSLTSGSKSPINMFSGCCLMEIWFLSLLFVLLYHHCTDMHGNLGNSYV